MPLADRFLAVRRAPHSDVRSSPRAATPERAGFVPIVQLHETCHRVPIDLTVDEETRLTTKAVARLRAVGYHVDCDKDFHTARCPASLSATGRPGRTARRVHPQGHH